MSDNTDWNPDLEFIEFMKRQLEKEGIPLDESLVVVIKVGRPQILSKR